jgi:CRP-like cAMP-binding protein
MSELIMSKYYFSNDFIEYEDIISKYDVQFKHYTKDEFLSTQFETLTHGYYIKKGILKLSIGSECGKEKILALFGPGSIFPLGINEHHYELEYAITEQALTDVEVYKFTFTELRKVCLDNPELPLKIVGHYCDFTSFLFYEISSLSSDSSFVKTCNILYALSETGVFENNFIELKQDEIADFGGISKIKVARAYQTLKSKDIIEMKRNGLIIKDREELLKLCSPEYL